MGNPSSHLPGTDRLLVCNRAVSKISDFAKSGNSQNRNVLNISTNILHSLAKMFCFNCCTKAEEESSASSALAAAFFLPEVPGHSGAKSIS